mgnify:FL=1
MAQLIAVDSAADPRLNDYRDLRDVTLRKSLESDLGLFLAEGEKVLRRALAAGYPARSFMLAERWVEGLQDVLASSSAPCYVVSEALAEQVTGFHVHRGVLASMQRVAGPPMEQVLAHARTVVVLEDVVDHTNVGAIFRSAAALGADAILLSPRCADPLYRRSIKVAMGAVFSLPWARLPHWQSAVSELSDLGFATVALTLAPTSRSLPEVVQGLDKVALLLGTEGHGLSRHWTDTADHRAVIEMDAGIDSLNVAAACAVACYVVRSR